MNAPRRRGTVAAVDRSELTLMDPCRRVTCFLDRLIELSFMQTPPSAPFATEASPGDALGRTPTVIR